MKLRAIIFGLFIALAFLSPQLTKAQSAICNQTTCTGFLNSDMYQVYSAIRNQSVSVSGGTVYVIPSSTAVTYSSVVTGSNGSVLVGAKMIMFTTSNNFSGEINGAARPANFVFSISPPFGGTLPVVGYSITAGSLTIDQVR